MSYFGSIYADQELSHRAKTVYMYLKDRSNADGTCWPSVRRIAEDLQKAMSEVKTLTGLLPICANCKKIRDDSGYWHQIEIFVRLTPDPRHARRAHQPSSGSQARGCASGRSTMTTQSSCRPAMSGR